MVFITLGGVVRLMLSVFILNGEELTLIGCKMMFPPHHSCLMKTIAFLGQTVRTISRIPHYEYHIRFSPKDGRKRPSQDVLDRFKRLNNGIWIRAHPGKNKLRYMKEKHWQETSLYLETCTKEECEMLDKMMTPFWLRSHHYPNDPYAPYHLRHGINSPRVDEKGNLLRERRKEECEMLDKMMTPFWLRSHHYPNDPYAPYHLRHGINSPRVDEKGNLLRERRKILIDDITSDKHFRDR
ncbi:hypothetical protein DICVIV_09244 [Dictyocaulus viviparus]|uniref:39S ribosomal protein L35, mitochondrial n=1 Tax=Dictyocaulus viviparus TaxID=29172 RepID=A0A0D8XJD2_DICVI|nr:hypothetical protein DICVIV_09244 [Dictyocaulus viviparus]